MTNLILIFLSILIIFGLIIGLIDFIVSIIAIALNL